MTRKMILLFLSLALSAAIYAETKTPPATCNIVVSGSSTVWGQGLLDDGFVGPIDDYVKQSLSDTVMPDEMRFTKAGKKIKPEQFSNAKQYKGRGYTIKGVGAAVEFELSGDELAVCQTIQRTADWAKLAVYANGKRIAEFTNRNPTMGSDKKMFTGDGKTRLFELERPFTYQHRVDVGGSQLKGGHNVRGYMSKPPFNFYPDYDYLIVRKNNKNIQPVHAVLFKKAPEKGAQIKIDYKYGTVVAHTKCTVGEDDEGKQLESRYGVGRIHHDPANPTYISTGLDFRYINRDAFFIHRFTKNAKRKIKIEVEGGVKPYFTINFATNRYHNLMNAGIGGFQASNFLNDRFGRTYLGAVTPFLPDLYFIALGGNDDWREPGRLVSRTIDKVTETELAKLPVLELHAVKRNADGTYQVVTNTGIIDAITPTSLISTQLIGTKVKPGNFIRIGNYSGDNNSVAVRVISSVDTKTGKVAWQRPLSPGEILCVETLDDLVGTEIAVRSLSRYTANMDQLIRSLKTVNPVMQIILLNVYNTDFFTRQIWGYPETQRLLAGKYKHVHTIDAAKSLQEFQMTNISGKNAVEIKADGSSEYTLPWKGHWQGFRVWVDNEDVYGQDCLIQTGWYYQVPKGKDGKFAEFERDYNRSGRYMVKTNMKLKFLKNPPKSGTIRVERADTIWSGDYAHPGRPGIHVIGRECISKLRSIIGE